MRMPNIALALREEISRLSRKEIRSQVAATKNTTTQYRRHIAALKRQVARLERQFALLSRKVLDTSQPASATLTGTRPRFVAKGLRSQRKRLDLSAAEYGKLLGVSAQSIYNWERELASPRNEQLSRLAGLRGIGKREAAQRLKQLRSPKGPIRRKS
jgi:DNA-binding transcriptional regulator YiaG